LPVGPGASASLLAVLLLIRFADEWFTFFPAGALESIRADLGLSYTQAGFFLTALGSGGLIGHGFKVAADYVDRRRIATAGALVYGLCLVAIAAGHTYVVLIAAGFIWGAASDAFISGCEVTLIQIARGELVTALGRANAYGAIGDLLGPLTLAAAGALGVDWRTVFAFGGALMLGYAAWIFRQKFPPNERQPEAKAPLAAVVTIAKDRRIILLAVIEGLFGVLDEPFLGFTVAYLERVREIPASLATLIVGASLAAGLLGYLVAPRIADTYPARMLLLGSGAVLGLAVTLIVVAPAVAVIVLAAVILGLAGATFYTVVQATYFALHPGQAGTTDAVISTISLAGVGFPTLVGAISDGFGLTVGLGTYAAVPLIMLVLVAALPSAAFQVQVAED
jgi:predicted MFS family arabinose efflux permease